MLGDQRVDRVVVGDQLGAPALGLVQRERVLRAAELRARRRPRASGSTSTRAHQLADVLHLAAPRLRGCACAGTRAIASSSGSGRPRPASRSSGSSTSASPSACSSCDCLLQPRLARALVSALGRRRRRRRRDVGAWSARAATRRIGARVVVIIAAASARLLGAAPTATPNAHAPSRLPSRLRLHARAVPASSSRTRWRSPEALGASDAGAEVSEGVGLSVSVRKGEIENVERNRDKSIGVTVYVGQRRGNASTLRLLARRARADGARRLRHRPLHRRGPGRRPARRRRPGHAATTAARDLDLFHPWAHRRRGGGRARARAARRPRSRSTGASPTPKAPACRRSSRTSTPATRRGFRGGYAELAPLALGRADRVAARQGRRRHAARRLVHARCATPASWPRRRRSAAMPPSARCRGSASRKIKTCEVPVLFESPLAAGLLGAYVQATSGGALYRKSSFLLDSLGQAGAGRRTSTSHEDPHLPRGKGSAPFDDEGVRTRAARRRRRRRGAGLLPVELLGAQARHAHDRPRRRLAQPDADAAALTQPGDDLDAMLRKLDRGLFVIELMGQGVNYVTGDYSRGAAGFWVESGRIAYPVHEITIAGNLRDMFEGHRRRRRRRLHDGQQDHRLGADRADEDRRALTGVRSAAGGGAVELAGARAAAAEQRGSGCGSSSSSCANAAISSGVW